MKRVFALCYGMAAYGMFLGASIFGICFTGDVFLNKSIDRGHAGHPLETIAIDLMLISAFALQHTVMARRSFKTRLQRLIPQHLVRSTFVLCTSIVLLMIFHYWRPLPITIWDVTHPIGSGILQGAFWLGWAILITSTFMIDHFDLFGLKQVYFYVRQIEYRDVEFKAQMFYRFVRHPGYTGLLLAFWAAPHMTAGHLVFALAMTLYIRMGIVFEERDLARTFGETYKLYQKSIPMLIPSIHKRWV